MAIKMRDYNNSIERVLNDDFRQCLDMDRSSELEGLIPIHRLTSQGLLMCALDCNKNGDLDMYNFYLTESMAYFRVSQLYRIELDRSNYHATLQSLKQID